MKLLYILLLLPVAAFAQSPFSVQQLPDNSTAAPPPAIGPALREAIMFQIMRQWQLPEKTGVKDPRFTLVMAMKPDGTVSDVQPDAITETRLKNAAYRNLVEEGMRAVAKASPIQGLPPEKYEQWQSIEISFDLTRAK